MQLDQTETGEGATQLTGGTVADWSTQFVTHTRTGLDSGGCTRHNSLSGRNTTPSQYVTAAVLGGLFGAIGGVGEYGASSGSGGLGYGARGDTAIGAIYDTCVGSIWGAAGAVFGL